MDKKQGWSASAASAKSQVVNALDALTPVCAPFAARWDAEADRRAKLRTPEHLKALLKAQKDHNSARSMAAQAKSQRRTARAASNNPLNAARRAARTADKAARQQQSSTKAALKAARREYPATLRSLAVRAHALHAVPASVASWVLSADHGLTVWPVSVSAGLVGLNAAALWLGRRTPSVQLDDGLSAEERQLMTRLDPAYWVANAPDRGLSGTVTTPPEVTAGGIRCGVRLDGPWTVKALTDKADSIRALLGARTGLRIRITSGTRGGWAVLSLATRQATDGTSSLWTPKLLPADAGLMSLGLDTETGEEVLIPFDERLLVSGASGTGKSWSTRPLMATAHLRGDLVLIDGKGEEANVWEHVCRVAVEAGEIRAAIDEAHAEMTRRKRDMKRRGLSVWDGAQLTVVIDEGQVVLALVNGDKDRLQRLIELSSLGRSRGVVLWWATQYPVTDGSAPGVHKMIAPNLLTRFSLRVAGTTQAQVALDDCAHYAPNQIPEGKQWRGHGYLKGYGPRMIRTWTLDDDGVRSLPVKSWQGPAVPVQMVKAEAPAEDTKQVTNRDRVLEAVRDGARTGREIADRTGLNKGTVSRELGQLVKAGALRRAEDGAVIAGGAA
ncbi:MarR family transcriptional regulator [Streptantibioticus rubrisoli]|uniref:FtsK/SpoIIIE domain-containing protein n=1 Tax=Streptantibioticus rubrisoli TaxID=1387313 RepID=A0ABT1PQ17_9ACTN|nr:winged helix-turn-helix domain-containing protein [Streptantibioticus rubrisoli]MCQ4046698.1 FtsK/SpoIIIE domain-containing protein [Streptantibioticus rubrisoli]